MIERYLTHKKWTDELRKYLSEETMISWILSFFVDIGISRVFMLTELKNKSSYTVLKNVLKKDKRLEIYYMKSLEELKEFNLTYSDLLIAAERFKAETFKYSLSFLTPFDIHSILENKQNFDKEIPRCINTIENGYKTIAVVGNGNLLNRIRKYLGEGRNRIYLSNEDFEMVQDNSGIKYSCADLEADIVILADLRVDADIIGKDGKLIPAFYWRRLIDMKSIIHNEVCDLVENVVPYLVEKGVKVLWCQGPSKKVLYSTEVKKKIERDYKIARRFPQLYAKIRKRELEKEGLGHMHGLEKNVRIDFTKGYRECFGNMKYLNYDNGFRRTIGNDSESQKNVWVFGPCTVDSYERVDDKHTIPSLLKEMIGEGYNVLNRGGHYGGISLLIRNMRFKKGDVVIIVSWGNAKNDKATSNLDLTLSYQKIVNLEKHVNDSLFHADSSVVRQIAEDIYHKLIEEKFIQIEEKVDRSVVCLGNSIRKLPAKEMLEKGAFIEFLEELEDIRDESITGKIGAIVMNCNPFTLGHRFLIETAAKQVERLYVFVVEEDKSFFAFADRFELVKQGTADLNNVQVIPSGNYIISSQTLAGYFEKDTIGNIYLDATTDLELFAQIAEVLNITVRFAGEEPFDMFTRQYNRNMKDILEAYGIEFVEIARKEEQGEPISASRVRALLKQKDFDAIAQLVPETTYKYLLDRFH